MKQFLRTTICLITVCLAVLNMQAAVVNSIAEVKASNGGDLQITADHPVYVLSSADGYYMLYDGTSGIFFYDAENYLPGLQTGNVITSGTIYFGYISFIKQFNLYKAASGIVKESNGTIADPISLPTTLNLYDRGTYFTAHGTFSGSEGSITFTPDEGPAHLMSNFFGVSGVDFASLSGKTGTLTAVVTYSGSSTFYSPLTTNFFQDDNSTEEPLTGTFAEVLGAMRNNGDGNVSMIVPANAQILYAKADMIFVWDGTMGVSLYNDYGSSNIINGFNYDTMGDGFGYTFSGTMTGTYEDAALIVTPTSELTLGTKTTVTPIVATGAEVAAADRSMLYTYVQMTGNYTASTRTFVADDGTEFAINGASKRGIPTQDGHGTLKVFMYGGAGNGQLVTGTAKMQLVTLEDDAFTYDDDPGNNPGGETDVKTFAEVFASSVNGQSYTITMPENAQMLYEFLLAGGAAEYECVFWDGTGALRLYVQNSLTSILPDRVVGTRNFGKKVSGTLDAQFENTEYFCDYYVGNSANLQLGDVSEVPAKEVTGSECLKEDKSNLHAYVKMTGIYNHETQLFTSDDGKVFTVNAQYSTVTLPAESGPCTIKAMFAGGIYGTLIPGSGNPNLFLLEENAISFGGDTPSEARTLSLANLKNEPTGQLHFKFEADKVSALAVKKAASATADDRIYLWDGTDGLMIYGQLAENTIVNATKGQIVNGEIYGYYYPNYGGMLKYDANEPTHKVEVSLGATNEVTPLLVTLADIKGKSDNTYSYAYVKMYGKIENEKFVDGNNNIEIDASMTNVAPADLEGKTGYIYAIYNPEGNLVVFEDTYFVADEIIENEYSSFYDLITNAADQEQVKLTLPAGSQILDNEGNHLWLWDGNNGLYVYSKNGFNTILPTLADHSNGNLLAGTVEGKFDATFFDIELEEAVLQLGTKQTLTAKTVTGEEAQAADRSNLYAYVEMRGEYDAEAKVFTTEDNVRFYVRKSETSSVALPTQSGRGVIKAMVYGNGTGELYEDALGVLRVIEPNAFTIDNDEPGNVTIADFLNTVQNGQNATFRMPANAVILLAGAYSTYIWDGTAGMQLYADNGTASYLLNWNNEIDNCTGKKVIGEFTAPYNDMAYSFDNPTQSTLWFDQYEGLTPKKVTGAEACNEDRSNLFAYIEMTGTYDTATKVFIADDGTAFAMYTGTYIGVPMDDGHGMLKAMTYGNRGLGKIRQDELSMPYLMTVEENAFVLDEPEAIGGINANIDENTSVYDLQGRKMTTNGKALTSGIYVIDGKKVIIK